MAFLTNHCAITTIECPPLKMEKKFIFLPGDMELDIDDTSCPSNKTSNRRYAILTFPIVDIIFTSSQNMID